MNRFQKPNLGKRILQSVNFSILFFLVIIAVFLYGIATVSSGSAEDERRILDEAIHKDIVHCYAVEGMYPPTLDYMEEHYSEKITLEQIARLTGYNRTYISGLVKSELGGFFAYVNRLRMTHAERLLAENPGMPVREAIDASGFGSSTSYYKIKHQLGS